MFGSGTASTLRRSLGRCGQPSTASTYRLNKRANPSPAAVCVGFRDLLLLLGDLLGLAADPSTASTYRLNKRANPSPAAVCVGVRDLLLLLGDLLGLAADLLN